MNEAYRDFYERYGLDLRIMEGIDCLCDNPKGCGYICHSGVECKKFKPNFRYDKIKGMSQLELDKFCKQYEVKKRPKSELKLKLESLESRILKLEKRKK